MKLIISEVAHYNPNPVNSVLTVQNNERIDALNIVDITGRTVYHSSINNTVSKIDVRSFDSGIYLVQVLVAGKTLKQQKIIIN